jgi:hypothetical protein
LFRLAEFDGVPALATYCAIRAAVDESKVEQFTDIVLL